jgi:hypothetical protein
VDGVGDGQDYCRCMFDPRWDICPLLSYANPVFVYCCVYECRGFNFFLPFNNICLWYIIFVSHLLQSDCIWIVVVETWPISGPKTRHELVMNLKKICDASRGSMNYGLGKFMG